MYYFLKIWARLALIFYCSRITIRNNKSIGNAPAILAANHPNSFLDAIILGAYHPRELYFLARGDAFGKPLVNKILRAMNMIPIYRLSEGKDNLSNNEKTFEECIKVLKKNGTLLIFSEGLCKNELIIRALKKGTARIAYKAWQENKMNNVVILPVSLQYDSFHKIPKEIGVNYEAKITCNDFEINDEQQFFKEFNTHLFQNLESGLKGYLPKAKPNSVKKILLALPALFFLITQKWLYILLKNQVKQKTKDTVFYDSVLFALLMTTYPLLVVIITIIAVVFLGKWLWGLLLLLPFTAWGYKECGR